MNIAICDNDKLLCCDIARLISERKPQATVQIFHASQELLSSSTVFPIIFLDIRGVAGLDIARAIRERERRQNRLREIIVFVTGYQEYMAAAFDVQAFHYLLKPIREDKFGEVLENAWIEAANVHSKEAVLLKTDIGQVKIALADILFAESADKTVLVHTADKIFTVRATMESLTLAFGDNFYRAHRCYLVNMAHIVGYNNDTIRIVNGREILLAQKKHAEFVKTFLRYARRGGIVRV